MQKMSSVEELITYKDNEYSLLSTEKHRRYFKIAGIIACLESELDLTTISFEPELEAFAVAGPGDDNVTLRHHFEIPDLKEMDLGREVYRKAPWAVSIKGDTWCYKGILPNMEDTVLHRLVFFNTSHTRAVIYSPPRYKEWIESSGWPSLSLMPSDQIWLGPLLADRSAVLLHSAAAIVNGHGLIFVGHSDAGKSTTIKLLKDAQSEKNLDAEILCDDRNVIRHWPSGWRVHGTWSHGDIADVSPSSAPLHAVLFLEQAKENIIIHLTDRRTIWRQLLATMIKPMVTAKWWQQELDTIEKLIKEVPCYTMRFDKSGAIVKGLERFIT